MTPTLELQAICKSFGDLTAVNGVSFAVPQGTIYGLLGPNGAGKTTTLRMIMDIIRNDSHMHHRVQQFLIDSITRTPITMSPEDLAEVWGQIEAHDELERQTIELAKELKEQTTEPMHRILLDYLLRDEEKHDTILGDLEAFKKHMAKLS